MRWLRPPGLLGRLPNGQAESLQKAARQHVVAQKVVRNNTNLPNFLVFLTTFGMGRLKHGRHIFLGTVTSA